MNKIILTMICASVFSGALAQKRPIDTSDFKNWTSLGNPQITNNGCFFSYTIENQPVGSHTLVIQSTGGQWKKEFPGASAGIFSENNRQAVFTHGDTLVLLQLGKKKVTSIPNVGNCKWPESDKGRWVAYQLNDSSKEVVLFNLINGKEQHFASVADYSFDDKGTVLLLKIASKIDGSNPITLKLARLSDGNVTTIWSSEVLKNNNPQVDGFRFDANGTQLVFMVHDKLLNSIWYYNSQMDKAILKVDNESPGIGPNESFDYGAYFSRNGRWIFFNLQQQPEIEKPKPNTAMVDVWSYKDTVLQSTQLQHHDPIIRAAYVSTNDNKIIPIGQGNEIANLYNAKGDFVLVNDEEFDDPTWAENHSGGYFLFSLKDKTTKLLEKEKNLAGSPSLSTQGNYVVFYDKRQNAYFSYDIKTGKTYNISKSIPVRLYNEYVVGNEYPVGLAGWLDDDAGILIYDEYDIWLVDPKGLTEAINVTNGYGRLHHIKFRIEDQPLQGEKPVSTKSPMLLSAFDDSTKDNGFFQLFLNRKKNPQILTMGAFILDIVDKPNTGDGYSMKPLKARDANIWIVQRQTASSAPNYFLTKDFKQYQPLTNLEPQKNYNWLTTELVTWKQLDGTISQGILYKPEDFDPHKKYPLIFNYYEQLSFDLNAFLKPGYTENEINLPWFISHGYLVFRPDFHFSVAKASNKVNGENAYNAVVSAAHYLSKLPWVDSTRMALNGHSFGGGITNYLVAHTHLFAAAAEAAGTSDAISANLSLGGSLQHPDYIRLSGTQIDQGRMGVSIWQRPDLYFRNSAVLKADSVTAPLLMMHNMADSSVPWGQGVEFYLALRYLHKKVWMLQYDNGGHGVSGEDAVDYTIRLTQFFDYYLKSAPAPIWMTKGIPAQLKGVDTGYELDTNGKKP